LEFFGRFRSASVVEEALHFLFGTGEQVTRQYEAQGCGGSQGD